MATTLLTYDALGFDPAVVPLVAGDRTAYVTMLQGRTLLAFIDGADESGAYTRSVEMPQAYAGGALTAKLYIITAATSGSVVWEVYVEAVTDADATDLDAAASWDTANSATVAVPATAGYLDVVSVTLTNKDSVAAGDLVRFGVRRDSDAGGDDAAATAYLIAMSIQE